MCHHADPRRGQETRALRHGGGWRPPRPGQHQTRPRPLRTPGRYDTQGRSVPCGLHRRSQLRARPPTRTSGVLARSAGEVRPSRRADTHSLAHQPLANVGIETLVVPVRWLRPGPAQSTCRQVPPACRHANAERGAGAESLTTRSGCQGLRISRIGVPSFFTSRSTPRGASDSGSTSLIDPERSRRWWPTRETSCSTCSGALP